MKKLKLNVEELAVVSFDLAAIEEPRGTVNGAMDDSGDCSRYCGATIFEYIWEGTWMKP
ncbi:MAG TPA: hypothetical protein VGC13_20225 [Longimicrobium sp.]|uniref:hypothetical protein n=1 Tax=Longimicrobium sp. TaxID=2029185 RepID=UPI002ED8B616